MFKKIAYIIVLFNILSLEAYWDKIENLPAGYANNVYLDVFFLKDNPDLGWISGFQSMILFTTDGGDTWEGRRVTNHSVQLESIMFVNDSVGYTSGPENTSNQDFGYIFKSTDGGNSWFDVSPTDNDFTLWGHYFTDENYGVVTGSGCYESTFKELTSYYTTDGGISWHKSLVEITNNNVLNFSKFSDPIIFDKDGLAYAVSSGVIWISYNGGKKWEIFSYTGGFDWHEEIAYADGTFLVPVSPTCHGANFESLGELRISTNNGAKWEAFETENVMYGTFLLDKNTGWGVGFDALIYYTSDGGKNWELRNCGIDPSADMDDIRFIDDTTGFVVGQGVYRYNPKNPLAPKITSEKINYICDNDAILLSLEKDYNIIKWSTGDSTKSIIVTEPGEYYAYAENSRCESGTTESVIVEFFPDPDINIQRSVDGTLCTGDTLEVFIDGNYSDFYWDDNNTEPFATIINDTTLYYNYVSEDGCVFRDSIVTKFYPIGEVNITNTEKLVFCTGFSLDLLATKGFSHYEWYNTDSNEIIGDQDYYNVTEEGFYYVVIFNEYGCIASSDTVFVEEVNLDNALSFYMNSDTVHNVGEVIYPNTKCNRLVLINDSDEDFNLTDTHPIRNIEFSIPKSQLPIIIPARDTASIIVCYNPTDIEIQRDTIRFPDNCSFRYVPVMAEGIGYADTSDGLCEIPVEFDLVDIVDEAFLDIREPYPQPVNGILYIDYYSGSTNDKNDINIEIMNNFGTKINSDYTITDNIIKLQKGSIAVGKISIDCSGLDSGMYLLKLSNAEKVVFKKIIIQK